MAGISGGTGVFRFALQGNIMICDSTVNSVLLVQIGGQVAEYGGGAAYFDR